MKKLFISLSVSALALTACMKKDDTPKKPLTPVDIKACKFTASDRGLQIQGKTEIALREIPRGSLKFVGSDYYVVVNRKDKASQSLHMKTASDLKVTENCGSNVTAEDGLVQKPTAVGISDYAVDGNYIYLRAMNYTIYQQDSNVSFTPAQANVQSNTSPYELLQGWDYKIYLKSATEYELRATRSKDSVEETLVTQFVHTDDVMTEYASCVYQISPIPLDRTGTQVAFKDIPTGTLQYKGSDLYFARHAATGLQSIHARGGLSSQQRTQVICATGLDSTTAYDVSATAVSNVEVSAAGTTILTMMDFAAHPVGYKIVVGTQGNSLYARDAKPDDVMTQLWQTNYRLYKLSDSNYELRAMSKSVNTGEETYIAVRYDFFPGR